MKFVVIGERSGASMDAIMAVYPRHKAVVDAFVARSEVIGIGPFADRATWRSLGPARRPRPFQSRTPSSARAWSSPFVIRDWNDSMLT